MPRTRAGRTYKQEWQRLATYLATAYPGVRHGSVVETVIWLLEQRGTGVAHRPTNTTALVEDAMAQARRLLGEEGRD